MVGASGHLHVEASCNIVKDESVQTVGNGWGAKRSSVHIKFDNNVAEIRSKQEFGNY